MDIVGNWLRGTNQSLETIQTSNHDYFKSFVLKNKAEFIKNKRCLVRTDIDSAILAVESYSSSHLTARIKSKRSKAGVFPRLPNLAGSA